MMEKMITLLKTGVCSFPYIFLLKYKELSLSDQDFILFLYLLFHQGEFNPKQISEEMKIPLEKVLECIDHLTTLNMIQLKVLKRGNIREEFIDFDPFYHKLALEIVGDKSQVKETNLYDLFEKEFARPLSPLEYELIGGWKEDHFSDELIISALKEAVFNGVTNLRYIDKILYEWKKKGIQTKEDIEKNRKAFQVRKVEKKELFDYDWLNDNNE